MRVRGGASSADPAPQRDWTPTGARPPAIPQAGRSASLQAMLDVAIRAAVDAASREKECGKASETLQQASEAAVKAISRVTEEIKGRPAADQHLPETPAIRLAKLQAVDALRAVEKAATDATSSNVASEDASRDAQTAWLAAASANSALTELEMSEVRKKLDATRTMEEASRKAEQDAALKPSDEARAKAFLAKAAYTRKAAAAAVAEEAVKYREKATAAMERAANAAAMECTAQFAARNANELVVTLWSSAAKFNAGVTGAEAALKAREASIRANEVVAEADKAASVARQLSIEAGTKLSAARVKAGRMSSYRIMAETAAAKAESAPRSTIGVEAAKVKATAAVEELTSAEQAAVVLEKAASLKVAMATKARKLANGAQAIADEANRRVQAVLAKRQEFEQQAEAEIAEFREAEGIASEKNTVLKEAEHQAMLALKTSKAAAKSGKAWAERTDFAWRKAEAVAEKARSEAKEAADTVALHRASVDVVQQKIAALEAERVSLETKSRETQANADKTNVAAMAVEADANAASAEAARARKKAKDALAHKEEMARNVDKEIKAKKDDMDEGVALAAAIQDALAAEQAAREELAAAELTAHATSDDLNGLTNAKKQAELRAKEKADLATKAVQEETLESKMKLQTVKSANEAAQKAVVVVANALELAVEEAAASEAAVAAHNLAEQKAIKAAETDADLVGGANANRTSATEARWCRISGEGLRKAFIGEQTSFTIEAFDETGSQQPNGGDTFLVAIRCTRQGTRIPNKIFDNGNGTYTVRYRPTAWGTCSIAVALLNNGSVRGVPLPGSPFHCQISAVIASAARCGVEAPHMDTIACMPNYFTVSFRDESGALTHVSKSALEVLIQRENEYIASGLPLAWRPLSARNTKPPPVEEEQPMEDGKDGVPGGDGLASWSPLNGRPFVRHVSPRKELDRWARRIAINPARECERARHRDQAEEWNRLDGRSALSTALVRMPSLYLQDLEMDPSRIGFAYGGIQGGDRHQQLEEQYKVNYSVGVAGDYLLHVRLRQGAEQGDSILPGSPIKVRVVPGVPAPLSTRIPSSELPLKGYLPAPAPKVQPKDHSPPPNLLERLQKSRSTSGGLILWQPDPTPAEAPADLESKDTITCRFRLQVCDRGGNKCTRGGGDVTCGVMDTLRDIESSCEDQQDGTYVLTWWSRTPQSKVQVFIKIDGVHILGSPTRMDLIDVPSRAGEKDIREVRRAKSAPQLPVAAKNHAPPDPAPSHRAKNHAPPDPAPSHRAAHSDRASNKKRSSAAHTESRASSSRELISYRASQRSSRRPWQLDDKKKKTPAEAVATEKKPLGDSLAMDQAKAELSLETVTEEAEEEFTEEERQEQEAINVKQNFALLKAEKKGRGQTSSRVRKV